MSLRSFLGDAASDLVDFRPRGLRTLQTCLGFGIVASRLLGTAVCAEKDSDGVHIRVGWEVTESEEQSGAYVIDQAMHCLQAPW
jgi:hypothetical protein